MEHPQLYASSNHQTRIDNEEFLKNIKEHVTWSIGEKILDIGCGPGDLTANLLTKYVPEDSTIVGVDISEQMIKYANSTYATDRIKFNVMNAECKNILDHFARNSFDKIYSFYCLQWAQDQRQVIENLSILTKPGGEIFLIVLNDYPTHTIYEILSQSKKWSSYMKDYKNFISPYWKNLNSEKDLELLLKQHNFENVQVKEENKTFTYQSHKTWTDLVLSVNPFSNRIPESKRSEYYQDILNICSSSNSIRKLPGDQTEVSYKLLKVKAKKSL